MGIKSKLLGIAVLGEMLSEQENFRYRKLQNEISKNTPLKPLIPKGCKEYHFVQSGRFDTNENKWDDLNYIFSCIASNDKNAIKKFEKFEKLNNKI